MVGLELLAGSLKNMKTQEPLVRAKKVFLVFLGLGAAALGFGLVSFTHSSFGPWSIFFMAAAIVVYFSCWFLLLNAVNSDPGLSEQDRRRYLWQVLLLGPVGGLDLMFSPPGRDGR